MLDFRSLGGLSRRCVASLYQDPMHYDKITSNFWQEQFLAFVMRVAYLPRRPRALPIPVVLPLVTDGALSILVFPELGVETEPLEA